MVSLHYNLNKAESESINYIHLQQKVMKKSLILLLSVLTLFSCERLFCPHDNRKIEVVINDIPFKTEVYYRIPYTLKTWEWEKEGLRLQRIEILECYTNRILQTIEQED